MSGLTGGMSASENVDYQLAMRNPDIYFEKWLDAGNKLTTEQEIEKAEVEIILCINQRLKGILSRKHEYYESGQFGETYLNMPDYHENEKRLKHFQALKKRTLKEIDRAKKALAKTA